MGNLTKYNVAICLVVGWGGFSYGFGFAIFVSSLGQPSFYEYFKLDRAFDLLPSISIIGAINALFNLGLAIGSICQGWLADTLGRKKSFYLASTCALIGAALVTGAVVIEMLIVVRLLHGFGLGMLICLVPLYLTEVAPPRWRGLLSGLTTLSFGMGYVTCGWISVGTYFAKSLALQWRLPLAMACVGPLALLMGLPFIPESPRFLSMKGLKAEAWEVVRRIHQTASDPDDSIAHAEFTQIVRQVEFDKEHKVGYIDMFKKPSWRRRSLLALFIQFAVQSTGILGIANFITLILGSLGLTGVMPLLIYAVYTTVGTIFVVVAIFTVDNMGRRTMFLIGFPALAACLLIEGILQSRYLGSDSNAGLGACIAFIFIYLVFFQLVDAPGFIYVSEIFPTAIRAKGNSLGFFAYFVGAITYTTPAARAFQTIQWRMYLIYMALCLVSTVIVYFFVPETKQIPIEEIGALFGDEVVVHLTSDGHGIVEDEKMAKIETVATVAHTEKI